MRNLLRRLGARTGISLGLVLVVATVLIVARLIGGGRPNIPAYRPPDASTPSVAATEGDDGQVAPDPTAYSDDEAVRTAARNFATAWLRRDLTAAQWLDGMRPFATVDLMNRLNGVDPLDVPPDATLGSAVIRSRTDLFADVAIPIANGDALLMGMANQQGRWVVTTLDREVG